MSTTSPHNLIGTLFTEFQVQKKPESFDSGFRCLLAERTGLEPATPGVTGRYSNQLNYRSAQSVLIKSVLIYSLSTLFGAWRCPTLTWGNPTLPSALLRFTTEFGMGSGGTATLWSPSKFGLLSI